MNKILIKKQRRTLLWSTLLLLSLPLQAQKIDFNLINQPVSQVNETGYTPWAVVTAAQDAMTVDGVKLTLSTTDGHTLKSCWWKDGAKKLNQLIGDGVAVYALSSDGNTTQIQQGAVTLNVKIEGLKAGRHTLLAYHNNVDNYDAAPLKVLVNGREAQTGVAQTKRVSVTKDCGMSFVSFDVKENEAVTISYVSVPEAGHDYTQGYQTTTVTVNALIFDAPNPKLTASVLSPTNDNEHAACDGGSCTLQWTPGTASVKEHLYFGTDADNLKEVATVTPTDTIASYAVSGITSRNHYYWRVDEESSDGMVATGAVWSFRPRRIAFPGAEGYGRYAIGGRDGVVYHVTSLADNGDDDAPTPGTLRYGIKKVSGPRTIVFDVGGVITLKNRLTCSDKYVTIAGQTAPGHGIMLRNCPFGMASDGITRFMRVRLGHKTMEDGVIDHAGTDAAHGLDGMGMAGNDNAIMDHCSIGWTIDEAFSSRNANNITLQRTLISEALNIAGHPNYAAGTGHGYAATIGGGQAGGIGSFHHNLLAHNEGRNWSLSGGLDGEGYYDGHHDVFNNVVYNWMKRATDGGTHECNFVGNFYKMGPATTQKYILSADLEGTGKGTQSYYVHDNIRQAAGNGTMTTDKLNDTYRYRLSGGQVLSWDVFRTAPFFGGESLATVQTAKAAYKNVLSDVGCNMPMLDNHDVRMITETAEGTTSTFGSRTKQNGIIDSEEDKGCEGFSGLNIETCQRQTGFDTDSDGMPDWWETARGLNPRQDDHNAYANDTTEYTNLEDYLNWIAVPHFLIGKAEEAKVSLHDYFRGYIHQPEFSVASASEGLNYQLENGVLTIKGADNNTGFYTISITADDADHWGTMTRQFNIYCSSEATTGIKNIKKLKKRGDKIKVLTSYSKGSANGKNVYIVSAVRSGNGYTLTDDRTQWTTLSGRHL